MARKKQHAAHRREIRFFRVMFLISVLSQTEAGDSIHRIFKHLRYARAARRAVPTPSQEVIGPTIFH